MIKTQQVKMFLGTFLLTFAAFGAACSSGTTTAQTPRVKPVESPTPAYKPPKRVSRDVIKTETTETKEEAVKIKAK
ncbi:MAG TPA: hypothetical protein VNB22_19565 [Pyrinomonadaceae bacterium]|jgi:hypothetical protein|nr:hypothetical protein [Pyrinomonadaceae bacterium]